MDLRTVAYSLPRLQIWTPNGLHINAAPIPKLAPGAGGSNASRRIGSSGDFGMIILEERKNHTSRLVAYIRPHSGNGRWQNGRMGQNVLADPPTLPASATGCSELHRIAECKQGIQRFIRPGTQIQVWIFQFGLFDCSHNAWHDEQHCMHCSCGLSGHGAAAGKRMRKL